MKKPREFSIFDNFHFRKKYNSFQCVELANGRPLEHSDIHVIEKSAYTKAVEALQMIAMGYPGDPQLGVTGRDVARGCLEDLGEIK